MYHFQSFRVFPPRRVMYVEFHLHCVPLADPCLSHVASCITFPLYRVCPPCGGRVSLSLCSVCIPPTLRYVSPPLYSVCLPCVALCTSPTLRHGSLRWPAQRIAARVTSPPRSPSDTMLQP
ncbi:hypothetical protein BJV77DRAFT_1040986 [Russula vinacea]|nr:hypothetical protein BJV77DRAFT_1040986 [Russula vinacea]